MKKIFKGKVQKGKLEFADPKAWLLSLSKMEGKEVELTIAKRLRKRSLNQNAWYWGVAIELLSEHTGYEPEEVHEFLKGKFLKPKEMIVGKEKASIVPSTARLSVDGFSKYMDLIQRWADKELKVYIPSPGDYEGEGISNY